MAAIELVIELDASRVEAGARDVQQSIKNIKETVNELVAISKSSFKQLAEGMTLSFARWMAEAKNYGSKFLASFKQGLTSKYGEFISWLGGIGDEIASVFQFKKSPPFSMIREYGVEFVRAFAYGLQSGRGVLNEVLNGLLGGILNKIKGWLGGLKGTFGGGGLGGILKGILGGGAGGGGLGGILGSVFGGVGSIFMGPLGGLIGKGVAWLGGKIWGGIKAVGGFFKKLFFGPSTASKLCDEMKKTFGIATQLSQGLMKQMESTEKRVKDRITTISLHLADIVQETGINSAEMVRKFAADAVYIFHSVNRGHISLAEGMEALNKLWPMLSDSAKLFGMESTSEFQRLLEVVRGFGYELNESNEWVEKLGNTAKSSFEKFRGEVEKTRHELRELMLEEGGMLSPGRRQELSYQHGTPYVPRTGIYLLHRGEVVVPASRNRGAVERPQVINLQVPVYLGGTLLETRLFKIISDGSKDGKLRIFPSAVRGW